MKKVLFINILLMLCVGVFAKSGSQAMKVLNKATAIVGRKGGAEANFTVSGKKTGSSSSKRRTASTIRTRSKSHCR